MRNKEVDTGKKDLKEFLDLYKLSNSWPIVDKNPELEKTIEYLITIQKICTYLNDNLADCEMYLQELISDLNEAVILITAGLNKAGLIIARCAIETSLRLIIRGITKSDSKIKFTYKAFNIAAQLKTSDYLYVRSLANMRFQYKILCSSAHPSHPKLLMEAATLKKLQATNSASSKIALSRLLETEKSIIQFLGSAFDKEFSNLHHSVKDSSRSAFLPRTRKYIRF